MHARVDFGNNSKAVRTSRGACIINQGRAPVGGLVGAEVHARDVLQLVLGAAARARLVGEHDGGAAHAEKCVGDEHAALVARVPVQRDVLRGDDEGIRVALHLQSKFICVLVVVSHSTGSSLSKRVIGQSAWCFQSTPPAQARCAPPAVSVTVSPTVCVDHSSVTISVHTARTCCIPPKEWMLCLTGRLE